ncbi:hypothetical protein GCM10027060_25530 [Nesterenkonia halophila]|uniref:hypothetical protein n=1 Tax=Nesterenkonia halophila TaxID=302044 RepID=UPI0012925DB8|nr:hypothetical protein [Nesterenkonia halophila]
MVRFDVPTGLGRGILDQVGGLNAGARGQKAAAESAAGTAEPLFGTAETAATAFSAFCRLAESVAGQVLDESDLRSAAVQDALSQVSAGDDQMAADGAAAASRTAGWSVGGGTFDPSKFGRR